MFYWPLWCDGRLSDSIRGGTGQRGMATAVQGTGRPYGPGRDISRTESSADPRLGPDPSPTNSFKVILFSVLCSTREARDW